MMLLLCAAEGSGDAAMILRAAAELGLTADALDPAERSGLIRVDWAGSSFDIRWSARRSMRLRR